MNPKYFETLKSVDYSGFKKPIKLDLKNMSLEVDKKSFLSFLSNYILDNGLEGENYRCTEYGRKLYQLYDYLYYEYFD